MTLDKYRAWTGKEMISARQMGEDQLTLSVDGRGFINVNSANARLSEFYTHMVPLRYTGLNDRNGVEIYAMDKVRSTAKPYIICRVWYSVNHGAWFAGSTRFTKRYADNCEVIGNSYQNPELRAPRGASNV